MPEAVSTTSVDGRFRRPYGGQGVLPGLSREFRPGALRSPTLSSTQMKHSVEVNHHGAYIHGKGVFSGDFGHGELPLSSAMRVDGETAVLLSGDVKLADFRPDRALYFDLETTGLPRGTAKQQDAQSWARRSAARAVGTPLAFLIGALQVTEQGEVHVHQFLLRQQPDETAQLQSFCALLEQVDYLVSFNGRSFDRNILADRLVRNRMSPERILDLPHLDLLHPSARLYRKALGGSSLGLLERRVLGVCRPADEVSGAAVPEHWGRYLRTGDPRFLFPVLEHNVLDLFSLLTLGGHLAQSLQSPGLCLAEPAMLAGAARLFLQRGQQERGESLLRRLSAGSSHDEVVYQALGQLSEHLRKTGRHREAIPIWQRMMEEKGLEDLSPWRAAAIAFERRLGRPEEALELTREVLRRVELSTPGYVNKAQVVEFSARRERLERRLRRLRGVPKSAA